MYKSQVGSSGDTCVDGIRRDPVSAQDLEGTGLHLSAKGQPWEMCLEPGWALQRV